MVGTLPPTYYLIEHQDKVIGRGNTIFEAYESITNHYFTVNDEGRVTLNGRVLPGPSYLLKGMPTLIMNNDFTKEDALKDWYHHYASKYLPYTLHRCIKN